MMMTTFLLLLSAIFCMVICTPVPAQSPSMDSEDSYHLRNYSKSADGVLGNVRIPVRSIPPLPKGPNMKNYFI